eukprot:3951580-Ditylum_brightwellii.AAC.1
MGAVWVWWIGTVQVTGLVLGRGVELGCHVGNAAVICVELGWAIEFVMVLWVEWVVGVVGRWVVGL